MSLDLPALMQSGVAIIRDVAGSARIALEHWPLVGRTATDPIYATTPIDRLAFMEAANVTVTDVDGIEHLATAKFTFMEPVEVHERDRFVVDGTSLVVVKVGGAVDPTTGLPYAAEVWTGR